MKPVLEWIQKNVPTVVFLVVVIVAIPLLLYFSRSLNEGIQQDMSDRSSTLSKLERLDETPYSIEVNGQVYSGQAIVNERLLREVRELNEAQMKDAARIREVAVEHNRQGRGVLMSNLFPDPAMTDREVLPLRFHERLVQSYHDLLQRMRAGSPPTLESMRDELQRARGGFINRDLQRDIGDELTEEEEQRLRAEMTKRRGNLYVRAAQDINVYATIDALGVPVWNQQQLPTMSQLYDWQWRYWIVEDVLGAVDDVNRPTGSVLLAPVKRVVQIAPYEVSIESAASPSGGGFALGAAGGRGKSSQTPAQPTSGTASNPLDYSISLTGRQSTAHYDVRYVQIVVEVESARIPEFLDALSRRNFMTITDLSLAAVDPIDAAGSGFVYSSNPVPVSRLTLEVETVWLRDWTTQFMPAVVRQALGMPNPAAAPGTVPATG